MFYVYLRNVAKLKQVFDVKRICSCYCFDDELYVTLAKRTRRVTGTSSIPQKLLLLWVFHHKLLWTAFFPLQKDPDILLRLGIFRVGCCDLKLIFWKEVTQKTWPHKTNTWATHTGHALLLLVLSLRSRISLLAHASSLMICPSSSLLASHRSQGKRKVWSSRSSFTSTYSRCHPGAGPGHKFRHNILKNWLFSSNNFPPGQHKCFVHKQFSIFEQKVS